MACCLPRPICVYGFPSSVGGANTELWHTLKLWRSLGIEPTLFPQHEPLREWRSCVESIGCVVDMIGGPPPGAIVVGFCNSAFRRDAKSLRKNGCKTIGVPCMLIPAREEHSKRLYDRYVFQSEYQREKWMRRLRKLGLPEEHGVLIRGAFDASGFPFNPLPHCKGEPFIVGRLSRAYGEPGHVPALDKFPHDLWKQYEAIQYRPLKARVMGWSEELERYCGPPPEWAEVLPQGAKSSKQFLSNIHCLVPGIGACEENWPRVGLEAMAVGVPIIAEDKGGWREMLEYRMRDREEQSAAVNFLADNEDARIGMIEYGLKRLNVIVESESISRRWNMLFRELY